jgi:glycine oxidase
MRNQEGFKSADALVIGGGVIGLSIARSLAKRGMKRVTLVERSQTLGTEASHAAAGMIAAQAEADQTDAFLELACASRELYPRFAAELSEESGTDVELERSGTLYLALTDEDEAEIEQRFRWQQRAGLMVEKLSADEALRLEPHVTPHVRAALRFALDVQVENRRLVAALTTSITEKYGVDLLIETNVESLHIARGKVAGVQTSHGALSAPIVVLATGAWTSLIECRSDTGAIFPHILIEPVRGQMLSFAAQPRLTQHIIYSPRGYIVPRLDGRLLAGSTTEHAGYDKRVTCNGLQQIAQQALEIAPCIGDLPFMDAWAGLRPRAPDGLPVIGECAEARGLYYATGHYRNGIMLAPITGELLADAIVAHVQSPLLRAFSPNRFQPIRANQGI